MNARNTAKRFASWVRMKARWALTGLSRALFGNSAGRWSALRKLGSSPLARATIVVPIVGYLLVLNSTVIDWASRDVYSVTYTEDSASTAAASVARSNLLETRAWRLVFLYYGLTLTGIATAAFGILCPPTIKKYEDGVDYASDVIRFMKDEPHWTAVVDTLEALADKRRRFLNWACSATFKNEWSLCRIRVTTPREGAVISDEVPDQRYRTVPPSDAPILLALRTQYAMTDFERPLVRFGILVFYFAGLSLVTFSAFWGALDVTAAVFGFRLRMAPWLP